MATVNKIADLYRNIHNEISKVVVGKDETKEALMIALVAGGHVLIEGLPGTAKTTLAQSFAKAIGGVFKRIQFTPDMMPADITGFNLYSPTGDSRFVDGPIFANMLLADELNRTTPRTQSALLEAMQENQVSIEGRTIPLAKPFMVIATQVYHGGEGTYPLTDVQMDRFVIRVSSEYPSKEEEKLILTNIDKIDQPDIKTVASVEEVIEAAQMTKQVFVSPVVVDYIASLMNQLRSDSDVFSGPSIRASVAIYKCSRVVALLDGRNFVLPDDIKRLLHPTTRHRIRITSEAEMDGITPEIVLGRALESVPVPKVDL